MKIQLGRLTNPTEKGLHNHYSVEESILERNPRTGVIREIDIRITSRTNPSDRIMIECRDHRRRQDVQWIDALAGKSCSLGFNNTVAVSSSGFTENAITEAKDRGIVALHLKQAEEIDWHTWFMAIKEIKIVTEGPELISVSLGIPSSWPGSIPKSINLSQVVLVDTRDSNFRSPLLVWITGLLNEPENIKQIQLLRKRNVKLPYVYTHPCSTEMGFSIIGSDEFIPLGELKIYINYTVTTNNVPLDHLYMDEERILAGKTPINGVPTQIIIHEKFPSLTVLIEQDENGDHQDKSKSNFLQSSQKSKKSPKRDRSDQK